MKSKRNITVMKETICERFKEYVFSLDADELYNFLSEVDESNVLFHLSERCKEIEMPEEVFDCDMCKKIYGNCVHDKFDDDLSEKAFLICKQRFYSYCDTPAK